MGYMFRILFETSSGPQDIDPDIPTFTAVLGGIPPNTAGLIGLKSL